MGIFLAALFVIVCILLIVVVLLQKGRGGGLGAAFGGGSSSAFGTRTGDVFTWVTIVLTGLFLLLAVFATLYFRPADTGVAAPSITPPPSAIKEDKMVALQSRDKGAAIYFTVNGGEPTENSTKYVGPFKIKPGDVVRAVAVLKAKPRSAVLVAEYPVMPTSASAPALEMPLAPSPATSSAPAASATAPAL